MKHSLLTALIVIITGIQVSAQSGIFDSYDCRPEVELISRLEKERLAREKALRDSIEQAQLLLALQQKEQYRLFLEDTLNGWKYWTFVENFAFGKNRGGLPMITDLQALHPYFRDKVIELIRRCQAKGIELAVVETYRTHAKQHEYKTMGKKYTRSGAGKSKHQYGLAVDLVPIVNGEAQWHNKALWYKIGVIGEKLGLIWGGRWRSLYDPGHFEWTGGLSAQDLAKGLLPSFPKKEIHYPCLNDDLRILSRYWQQWESEQATYASKER
jgi:hypothetical protein